MRANPGTSRHTDTAGQGAMRANLDVMANLDQVVELDTIGDQRILQRATVDASVGTNFDVMANIIDGRKS